MSPHHAELHSTPEVLQIVNELLSYLAANAQQLGGAAQHVLPVRSRESTRMPRYQTR